VKYSLQSIPEKLEINVKNSFVAQLDTLDTFYGKGKIAGIIGAALLRPFKIAINFDILKIKFGYECKEEDIFQKNQNSFYEINITPPDDVYDICPKIQVCANDENATAVIDTGSPLSILPRSITSKNPGTRSRVPASYGNLNGSNQSYLYKIPSIDLGGANFKNLIFVEFNSDIKNVIGLDFLSEHNLYFDFEKNKLLLNRRNKKIQSVGLSGFSFIRRAEKIIIRSISPEFNSSEILFPGDEIILNNLELTDFQLDVVFNGFEGEEKKMKLRRKNKIMNITYKPISFFRLKN
jgi:predicted aspartyl protease